MTVAFLDKFGRDLGKINSPSVKKAIEQVIVKVESANSSNQIENLKKLSGTKNAFRIRLGDYRLGIYFENGVVQFARIVHRKDIYKVFP